SDALAQVRWALVLPDVDESYAPAEIGELGQPPSLAAIRLPEHSEGQGVVPHGPLGDHLQRFGGLAEPDQRVWDRTRQGLVPGWRDGVGPGPGPGRAHGHLRKRRARSPRPILAGDPASGG